MNFTVDVTDINKLRDIAQKLAKKTLEIGHGIYLLQGDLGAGKTTFVRFFTYNIPGSQNAEVSSPSFNLFNIYPTEPEIIHIDLYRCVELEEEILEYLSSEEHIVFVEWCEKLPEFYWPSEYILIKFKTKQVNRFLEIRVKGTIFSELLGD
ncbi:tRNA (adenosine(37)-N6)-threonylcarbamoyltransferase complex ATPase subunit type 1 TsaE [Desulfothermus okinawensis JCM 13304]